MKTIASLSRRASGIHLLAAVLLTAASGLLPASAKPEVPIEVFGTVIDEPGKYYLNDDLEADGLAGPAVIILADHVHLDLNGHNIVGNGDIRDGDNVGVHVAGTDDSPLSHVHISGGRVTGFHFAVWLAHASKCHVKDLVVDGGWGGIGLHASSKNHVKENVATANVRGIYLQEGSHDNHIHRNDCSQNSGQGIYLVGYAAPCEGNQIKDNLCNENGILGIWLWGACHENQIKNNEASDNGGNPYYSAGIVLGFPTQVDNLPAGNEIKDNLVRNNVTEVLFYSWDVFDNSVFQDKGCLNRWKNNDFDLDHETGADAGPGAGCIQ